MKRYILKKLWGMIPTLFGISLVTFAMVHLAPGDPVTMEMGTQSTSSAISAQVAEDIRRTYFLNLPLFINTGVETGPETAQRILDRLSDPEKRPAAAREVVSRGSVLFPYIMPHLDKVDPDATKSLLTAFDKVGERMGLGEEIEESVDRSMFWHRFWQTYRLDYTSARASRLVRRLAQRSDPLVEQELRRLDTFILPHLMESMADETDPGAVHRLSLIASGVTGRDSVFEQNADPGIQRKVVSGWKDWWSSRYADYVFPEGTYRFTSVITQTRFYKWLRRIVTLDFGTSLRDHRPVVEKLAERLPVTLLLSFVAVLVAWGLSIPIGVISAVKRGTRADRALTVFLFILYSLPAFWVAMIFIQLFCGVGLWDIFPIRGLSSSESESWPFLKRVLDTAWHLVLPVTCLSYVSLAVLSRYQRTSMLDVIRQGYITTARAKGLSEKSVIFGHALRNALIPVITLLGLQLPYLIGGSVIIESIFNIPGMGLETFEAIRGRDYNWIMAVTTITAVLTMLGIIISDLLYAVADPRLEPGSEHGREY